jgi:hypothetical protein
MTTHHAISSLTPPVPLENPGQTAPEIDRQNRHERSFESAIRRRISLTHLTPWLGELLSQSLSKRGACSAMILGESCGISGILEQAPRLRARVAP